MNMVNEIVYNFIPYTRGEPHEVLVIHVMRCHKKGVLFGYIKLSNAKI